MRASGTSGVRASFGGHPLSGEEGIQQPASFAVRFPVQPVGHLQEARDSAGVGGGVQRCSHHVGMATQHRAALLVHALAGKNFEEAAERVSSEGLAPDSPEIWDAKRFEKALAPFFEEYGTLLDTPESRRHQWTQIRPVGDRQWEVQQTLLDPQDDNVWGIRARVDLRRATTVEQPLLKVVDIGK